MKKRIFLIMIWMMSSSAVLAKEYDITPEPTYSWWGWRFDGWVPRNASDLCTGGFLEGKDNRRPKPTTYVCPNILELNDGAIVSDSEMTIRTEGTTLLKGNNKVGNSNTPINLSSSGEIKTEGGTNTINGNVTADRNITFKQTTVEGDVTSSGEIKTEDGPNTINGNVTADRNITFKQTTVEGDVTSKGEIKTEGGTNTINGSVTADRNITFKQTTVEGDVTSKGEIKTEDGTNTINGSVTASGNITLKKTQVGGAVTSQGGEVKTEAENNIILGNVTASGNITLKQTKVGGAVTSQGGEVKTESNANEIQGDVWARSKVTLKQTKVTGDVTSEGHEVILESHNQIHGNILASHKVDIKNSLVCGRVESTGDAVSLQNSKLKQNQGVFALRDAIKSHGEPILKQADICGSINPTPSSDKQSDIYCGVNEPDCDYAPAKCPVSYVESICGWEPEPEPLPDPQICINEDFTGENPLQNWTVMGRTASTTKPQVVGNRFQVSTNQNDQSTASAYKKTIPSNDNVVQIEFDHYARNSNTSPGGDGIAIVLSDSKIPPSPGATGGALGYGVKPDMEGFAGGWIAFGIDEYGNFSSQGSLEDSQYRPGRKKHSITIRGAGYKKSFDGTSDRAWFGGYKFITNNTNVGSLDEKGGYDSHGNYLAGRNSSDVHRYRMMVDSREDIPGRASGVWVSIERKINGSEWEPIIEPFDAMKNFGQPELPENFMVSITAGTGANTNIHEVAKMKLCADRFNLEPKIDHFRFEYDGTGDVCDAQRVTLTACMDSECTETYPPSELTNPEELEVTLTGLPNAEWQFSNGQSIPNNTLTFEHRVNLQIRSQGADSAKLGIEEMSIETPNIEPIKCKLNEETDYNSACTIVFGSSISVDVPDKVASLPFFDGSGNQYSKYSSTPSVSLCESVPSMPETDIVKDIEMMFAYEQPKSGETVTVRFKGSDGKFGKSVQLKTTDWIPINDVYFASSGKAIFDLSYPEVGEISVKARIKGDSDSEDFSSFVSFPSKLKVTAKSGNKSGECTNSEDGCSGGLSQLVRNLL